MMAAAQPFLSGAISKTVNMPHHTTVEEIMQTYMEAWELGLKAVAIYRDGSKRSAPFQSAPSQSSHIHTAPPNELTASLEALSAQLIALTQENETLRTSQNERMRHHMPETRMSITHQFMIAGHEGYITVGLYPNGRPGEVFVQMSKEGSTIGGLMDTVATLTSIALQYGVPLEQLVHKFAYQRFEPSGYTQNPDIRTAHSITDYIFRWMGCEFIQGYREATSPNHQQTELPMPEIRHMDQVAIQKPVSELPVTTPNPISTHGVKTAIGSAFMEIICSHCGSDKVIRAGACGVCTQCGTSQGCS
jgi:ribonucleoside-diphosphate reductase alpha chain